MVRRRWGERVAAATTLAIAVTVVAGFAPAAAEPPGWATDRVRFEPAEGAVMTVEGLGTFRGAIELRRGPAGVAVINDVALEDYVRGIDEVPANWPRAAMEAQAIASRTYALHSMAKRDSAEFRAVGADICATESCQVYRGLDGERRATSPGWVAAVDATAGRALLDRAGPILAKYSSSNGGHSDAGSALYLPAVDDPDDLAVSPWARWRSVLPLAQIASVLPGPGQLVELNRAGDVVVARRLQPDGSILDQGYSPTAVRRAFNESLPAPPGLPVAVLSTRFVAHTEGDVAVLDGGGYGHLTGMSQYGALGKARRGLRADDILAAYYRGLRSQPVAPDRLPARIRVALSLAQPSVNVSSTGRFRVVAGDGGAIAQLTGGAWRVTPGARGVQVSSTPDQTAAPRLGLELVNPAVLGITVSVPANVVLRTATGQADDLGVLDVGRHDITLTEPPAPGATTEIRAEADAGGGRVARSSITIVGDAPRSQTASLSPAGFRRPGTAHDGPSTEHGLTDGIAAGALALTALAALRARKRSAA